MPISPYDQAALVAEASEVMTEEARSWNVIELREDYDYRRGPVRVARLARQPRLWMAPIGPADVIPEDVSSRVEQMTSDRVKDFVRERAVQKGLEFLITRVEDIVQRRERQRNEVAMQPPHIECVATLDGQTVNLPAPISRDPVSVEINVDHVSRSMPVGQYGRRIQAAIDELLRSELPGGTVVTSIALDPMDPSRLNVDVLVAPTVNRIELAGDLRSYFFNALTTL
jgi:hypothetical protein